MNEAREKNKGGRPKLFEDRVEVSVYLDRSELEALTVALKGKSLSGFVRRSLQKWLATR